MATKKSANNIIRKLIIQAADIYSKSLSGKTFMYVFNNEYFEVYFSTRHFLHLTGVGTHLPAQEFYKNAKKQSLTLKQFYFDSRYVYSNAKKKLPCLIKLPELTTNIVCILKDMKTKTIIYKLSIANLEFTLGLTENKNRQGNKINNYYVPMSPRVEDSAVERSSGGEIVDFIFSKDASLDKYNILLFKDEQKNIPECIKHLLDDNIFKG